MASSNGLVRSRSLRAPEKTFLRTTTAQQSSGPSHIALFLTNIRLLDFDLLDGWPNITANTFSTKPSLENQKKRIDSTKWALYQLFTLWDPQETQDVGWHYYTKN